MGGGSAFLGQEGSHMPLPNPSPGRLPSKYYFGGAQREGLSSFAESAGRLAGVAGALLGWRPDEFWRATPAELGAVLAAMLPEAAEGMDATDLQRLTALFPDDV